MDIASITPYEGKEDYVFVSYCHKDTTLVLPILQKLAESGVRFWFDKGIDPGTEWVTTIAEHVYSCSVFLTVMSENASESFFCTRERNYAVNELKKDTLTVFLSETRLKPADSMMLSPFQSIFMYKYQNNPGDFYSLLLGAAMIKRCTAAYVPDAPKPQPDSEFAALLRKAQSGDANAQCNLGYRYREGVGTSKNPSEAFRWYKLSAEQGNVFGQYNLGYCYQYGIGTPKNPSETFRWFKRSAEQGNAAGQCNLGYCYENGIGTPKNFSEAFKWYKLSAEQGNAVAQNNLGCCYQYGIGTAINLGEARKWYQLAAEQGNESAVKALENL